MHDPMFLYKNIKAGILSPVDCHLPPQSESTSVISVLYIEMLGSVFPNQNGNNNTHDWCVLGLSYSHFTNDHHYNYPVLSRA